MPMFMKIQKPQEAVQWHKPGDHPAVVPISYDVVDHRSIPVWGINTKEGPMRVTPGCWIMTGPRGEHWAVDPDIFAETYREVTPKELERRAEIEKMRGEPGVVGSYFRLLERCSVHHVHDWAEGEKVRGVPPETLFHALGDFLGVAASYVAGMVGRSKMHKAAGAIYEYAHAQTSGTLSQIEESKRARELLRNPNIKLVKG